MNHSGRCSIGWLIRGLILLTPTIAVAQAQPREIQSSTGIIHSQLPRRAIVYGVPFVSWSSMARTPYEHWEYRNPSYEASVRMLLSYWIDGLVTDADFTKAATDIVPQWTQSGIVAQADVKAQLARGNPVFAMLPLTAQAHPLYAPFEIMIRRGDVRIDLDRGAASGALGRVLPLKEVKKFNKSRINPLTETVTYSLRVFVGYDDDLRIWFVHDPSFGPALPVSYDEVNRMLQAMQESFEAGEPFTALVPNNSEQTITKRQGGGPYRERSPDELAAWEFVNGYTYSATGALKEGESRLQAGLAIPNVSSGYRFLLTYELALTACALGKCDGAVKLVDEAIRIMPDHPGPWHLLADLCARSSDHELHQRGAEAEKRYRALDEDSAALGRVAQALPADFLINYAVPYRGWGGDRALSPRSGVNITPGK